MLDGLRRGHNFGCRCTHGGGPCDAIECGADEHNARVEALRAALAPGDAAGMVEEALRLDAEERERRETCPKCNGRCPEVRGVGACPASYAASLPVLGANGKVYAPDGTVIGEAVDDTLDEKGRQ